MRFQKFGTFGWALVLFAGLIAAQPAAADCSLSSFNGTYGVVLSGSLSSGQQEAGVYQIDADGLGLLSGTGTQSSNGTIETVTLSGSYSIASNCTGTVTLRDQTNATSNYNVVLDNGKTELQMIRVDPGYTLSGEAYSEGVTACGLTGKKAVYAKRLDGHTISGDSTSPVSIVGEFVLNGSGAATATDTFSENGVVTTDKLAGTYTASENCTGTAKITYKGTSYNFASVVVSAGKKLLLLETDAGTVISGKAIEE